MKKIKGIILALFLTGCVQDDINTDPNSAYTANPAQLVSMAQKVISDYMNSPNVKVNNSRLLMQYWQETIYVDESTYDWEKRKVSQTVWAYNYRDALMNLEKAKAFTNTYTPSPTEQATWEAVKKNRLAIIGMMQVYIYLNLVDTFGDVPYSQAINLAQYPLPAYDDAKTIYLDLIEKLKTHIGNLDLDKPAFGIADYFYGTADGKTDATKWKKFGASLLLKAGIALADSDPSLAQQTANEAIAFGVFSSASDSCLLSYLSSSPNFNPIYAEYSGGRNDFIAASSLIDNLKAKNDPRIGFYYEKVGLKPDGTPPDDYVERGYIGQTPGLPGKIAAFSNPGGFWRTPTTKGNILTYTEVAFYLAEVAARWNVANTTAAYNKAVNASLDEWGVALPDAVAYLAENPYNSTNWKESIGIQAWIAMYNNPLVSWNFYRRLDYPVLAVAVNAVPQAEGKVPVRMTYPTIEQQLNNASWASASAAIGGDKLTSKLFWDKY